jgi:hypothetical protein
MVPCMGHRKNDNTIIAHAEAQLLKEMLGTCSSYKSCNTSSTHLLCVSVAIIIGENSDNHWQILKMLWLFTMHIMQHCCRFCPADL